MGKGRTMRAERWAEPRVASFRPEAMERLLPTYEHGILSLAATDPGCGGENLQRALGWIRPRLRQGVVLFADSVETVLLQVRQGVSADRAFLDVDRGIQAFLDREGEAFQGEGCRFQFARVSRLLEMEAAGKFRETLHQSVYGGGDPSQGLQALAEAWIRAIRPASDLGGVGLHRQAAVEAILDHLIALAMLRSQGWGLHAHPGLAPALRWLNGDQPFEAPAGLKQMVFVELSPRIWP